MSDPTNARAVERLFPFVLRSGSLIVGRETLARSRKRLQFVLITTDLTENSKREIIRHFADFPIVQHYTSADLQRWFNVEGAKVVGFQKSGLARSIYSELKPFRIHAPASGTAQKTRQRAPQAQRAQGRDKARQQQRHRGPRPTRQAREQRQNPSGK